MEIADIMTGRILIPLTYSFSLFQLMQLGSFQVCKFHYANNNKYSSIGKISSLWIKAYKMCLYDIMLQLKLFYLEPRIHVEYNVSSARVLCIGTSHSR